MSLIGNSIKEVAKAFRNGSSCPSELFKEASGKIDKNLNAYVRLCDPDEFLKASDLRHSTRRPLSPIDGIPIAVKDNFCVKNYPATCASRMLENFVAPYNATVVEKSLNSGAIIVGKTNLDEFGMGTGNVNSLHGPTKSPFFKEKDDDFFLAGGSSGGSAVAVASGSAFLALGSDTGGSVRIPAAWTGIPSLKPTYGLLSRHGLIPLVNSLDVPGILGRHVEDLRIFFDILRGRDDFDSTTVDEADNFSETSDLKNCVIGIPEEYRCPGMTEDVIESWGHVADILEDGGFKVKPVSLPHTKYSLTCYSVLNPIEVASNMARYDGLEYGFRSRKMDSTEAMYSATRSHGFNDVVRGRILVGNYFILREHVKEYFQQAMKVRRLIFKDFQKVFENDGVDMLLTPVTLSDAPKYSEFTKYDNRTQTSKYDYCTQPVNLAGLPAATLPINLSSNKLPISLQIIGPRFSDRRILDLCQWLEAQVNFLGNYD